MSRISNCRTTSFLSTGYRSPLMAPLSDALPPNPMAGAWTYYGNIYYPQNKAPYGNLPRMPVPAAYYPQRSVWYDFYFGGNNTLPGDVAQIIAEFTECVKLRNGILMRQISTDDVRYVLLKSCMQVVEIIPRLDEFGNLNSFIENRAFANPLSRHRLDLEISVALLDVPGHWRTYKEIYKCMQFDIHRTTTHIAVKRDGSVVVLDEIGNYGHL